MNLLKTIIASIYLLNFKSKSSKLVITLKACHAITQMLMSLGVGCITKNHFVKYGLIKFEIGLFQKGILWLFIWDNGTNKIIWGSLGQVNKRTKIYGCYNFLIDCSMKSHIFTKDNNSQFFGYRARGFLIHVHFFNN